MRTLNRNCLSTLAMGITLGAGSLSTASFAAEDKATLILNLPALSYQSSNDSTKPDGGDEAKAKRTQTMTQDLGGSYAEVLFGKCATYFYPFNDAKLVSFGYLVTDAVEVGLDLGLNSHKIDKPKDESTSNTLGLYAAYTQALGKNAAEFVLYADSITNKGEKTEDVNGAETVIKTNSQTTVTKLTANYVMALRPNLAYVGGIWFGSTKTKDKEAKADASESGFGLNLMTLRLTLD